MTTRNEPTIGGTVLGLFTKTKVSHTQLVDNALEAFTKAETQMGEAINLIEQDIQAEQEAIQEAQRRITDAAQSKDRLSRVLDRVKALTA
jgi:hypothetical protein